MQREARRGAPGKRALRFSREHNFVTISSRNCAARKSSRYRRPLSLFKYDTGYQMMSSDSSREALLVLDARLVVRAANKAFYEKFRLAPEETVGRKVYEIGGKAWDEKLRSMLESVLDGLPQSDHFELSTTSRKPGTACSGLARGSCRQLIPPMRLMLLTIEGLTARRPVEEALAAKTEELHTLADLAGRCAHELNNLLTVIRMNSDLVLSCLATPSSRPRKHGRHTSADSPSPRTHEETSVTSRRVPAADDRTRHGTGSATASRVTPEGERRGYAASASRRSRSRAKFRGPLRRNSPRQRDDPAGGRRKRAAESAGQASSPMRATGFSKPADGARRSGSQLKKSGRSISSLTDVEMPTLGGRGMVDELHELSPGLRVLFMSGYTDNEILRRGINAATTDFLRKPFTGEALVDAVRAVLNKPATTLA